MRITLKDFVADGLIIGMGLCWLLLFSRIWQYGGVLVWESNILYRSLETALFIAILLFGVIRFVSHIKEFIEVLRR